MTTMTRPRRRKPPPAPLDLPKRSSYRSPFSRQSLETAQASGTPPPLPAQYDLATHISGLIMILAFDRYHRRGSPPATAVEEVERALHTVLKTYEDDIAKVIDAGN